MDVEPTVVAGSSNGHAGSDITQLYNPYDVAVSSGTVYWPVNSNARTGEKAK